MYEFMYNEYLNNVIDLAKINSKQLNLLIGVLIGHYLNIFKKKCTENYNEKLDKIIEQIEVNVPKLN